MGYAFISYSTKNQATADAMRELLKMHNIDTWMAPNDIPVGSKYAQVIGQAVKNCTCLLLLLSDDSQNSPWVAKEVERAINYRKTILPVQLEDIQLNDEFEMYISTDQIIAIRKLDENAAEVQKVLSSVIALTGTTRSGAAENVTSLTQPKENSSPSKPGDAVVFDMRQVRTFASCGNESSVFEVQKEADGQGIHLSVNFEKTRLRDQIPEYAGAYYLKHPAIDVSDLTQLSFQARSEDASIASIWVEMKPEGKAWMHESFDFSLSSEFKEFVINLADLQFPETRKCLEEITFVMKPVSFTNEDCLKGIIDIRELKIS